MRTDTSVAHNSAVRLLGVVLLLFVAFVPLGAADISGAWTASFDSDIGKQEYRYEFVVEGTRLTGTATGNLVGESVLENGNVDGNQITFVETGRFMGSNFRIE